MSKNQVPLGHIHTHSPQLPWINKKTKTWWIGNHDTKQPYRGVKGDSVKGDPGDRGNGWFLLSSSTDVSPEGAITDDLIMNSGSGDIMVAGVIVEPGEYVQVLSVNPFQVTDVLGSLKGPKGTEGDSVVGPPGNSLEIRYAKNKDPENAPTLNRSDRYPSGWSVSTINPESDEFVWETRGYVDGENNLIGIWSNPFRNTGVPGQPGEPGEGIRGPAMFPRGDWSPTEQYSGSDLVVQVVKYNGLGYMTITTAGNIPVGTLPTNTNYWIEFAGNIDSLFTDFLFSYSAYIQNLTVGQVSTGVEPAVVPDPTLSGERFTVGFQPSGTYDPTSTLSRHGMRLYFPSGRIMMYQGWVDNFDVGDGTTLTNKGVTIWFKDEENSPVDYYIDGGVITIVTDPDVTRWYHNNLRLINHVAFNGISPTDPDATGSFETAINSAGTPNEVVSSFLNGVFHYESLYGSVWINRTTTAWNKVVTGTSPSSKYVTANNGESFVPDGWYFVGTGDMRGIEASGIELDTNTSTGWPRYVDLILSLKFFYITNGEITNFAYPIANVRMATTSPQATGTFLNTNKTAQYTEEFILADN